jgi:hypothetical protein
MAKRPKPVLVEAPDLPAAWDLAFAIAPVHAVELVEEARRTLKTGATTRLWFADAFGPESLRLESLLARMAHGEKRPWSPNGYLVKRGSRAHLLKRLLKALGRNDWARAEAMLQKGAATHQAESRYVDRHGNAKTRVNVRHYKNARYILLCGAARSGVLGLAIFARESDCQIPHRGLLPHQAPSVPFLLAYRAIAAKRMQQTRLLLHAYIDLWGREKPSNPVARADFWHIKKVVGETEFIPFPKT